MDKTMIYELMNGWIDLDENPEYQNYHIENEFQDNKECDLFLKQIDEAANRLSEIVGDDNIELETIRSCYEKIAFLLSSKMFDYGYSTK